MVRKFKKLKFDQEAPGDYWYLRWIGKVIFKEGDFFFKVHFVNSYKNNDHLRWFIYEHTCTHEIHINAISFFSVGTIYNKDGELEMMPSDYYDAKNNVEISAYPNHIVSTKKLPFLESKYSFLKNDLDFSGFEYFKFSGRQYYDKEQQKYYRHEVVLPIHTLCQFLFFRESSRMISKIINNSLNDLFAIVSREVKSEGNKKIGYIKYNNEELNYKEAKSIALYIFMNNKIGEKSIKAISSRLKSFFINNENNNEVFNSGKYINTDWPFDESIKFILQGKTFKDNGQTYFITYRIVGIKLENRKYFQIDKLDLEEMYPKNSTKDRDNLRPNEVKGRQPQLNGDVELSFDSVSGNSSIPIQQLPTETDVNCDFNIPVVKVQREHQENAYTTTLIPTNQEVKGGTLNVDGADSESDMVRLNFNAKFLKINRFEFIRLSVLKLWSEYSVGYDFKSLNLKMSSIKTYKLGLPGHEQQLMAVRLIYEDYNFYLIEFEKGYTGFIHHIDFDEIIPFKLEIFLNRCLQEEFDLVHREKLWPKLAKKSEIFKMKYRIVICTSLTHQKKELNSNDQLASKMAKKIYYDRIMKLVS